MATNRELPSIRVAARWLGIGICCFLMVVIWSCKPDGEKKSAAQVDESDFESVVLKSKLPVLVDFSATWCGPCQDMKPIIEEVTSELKGKAKVVQVDIDQAPELARQYKVSLIPCFIVFKNGEPVARHEGKTGKQHLIDLLAITGE